MTKFILTDGAKSPYLGNLRQWLDKDADISVPVARLPEIRRKTIYGNNFSASLYCYMAK